MLDSLLVLGQIPGTSFQITFNELAAAILAASAIYEYCRHRRAIHRWRRRAWYRLGVNYRRYRRIQRTYLKIKRFRLAVLKRRIVRQTKSYLRRRRHELFMFSLYRPYSSLKRQYFIKLVQIGRLERRVKSQVRLPVLPIGRKG